MKKICPACAVEVRAGAVFCFNCGKSLDAAEKVMTEASPDEPREDVIGVSSEMEEGPEPGDKAVRRPGVKAVVRVRKAAEALNQPRRTFKRASEVEWAEPGSGPGALFVLGSVGVGLVSVLVFLLALYLK